MAIPPHEDLLATFDQLVEEGVIVYGPYETVEVDCEGYPIEFRICPSLKKKPHTVGAALDPAFDKSRKWGPGSDMFCPDPRLVIARLNSTHDLSHNLFCVDRPQFVTLTTDSYKRQYEPLDINDCAAALDMLRGLKNVYVIFNCSEAAGCSREHKHLQALIGPPRAFDWFIGGDERAKTIPFQFFTHHFVNGFNGTSSAELLAVYEGMLDKVRRVLGVSDGSVSPHNVILWRDWIIVVPRRKSAMENASANAAGMLGSNWVTERNSVDEFVRLGGRKVLEQLGVPR